MIEHIQINDVAPRIHYDADGVQSAFTYPFAIFKADDLEVWLGGVRQLSGYSVSGAGISSGGSVLFAVPPLNGSQIILRRRLGLQRVSDYQADGIIRAKTLNDEFDYQVAAVQQVAEDVSRCIRRPFTSANTASLALPDPQGGKALGWNVDGTALVNDPADFANTLAQVSAHAAQTAADEQSARGHRLATDADAAQTAQDRVAVAADRVAVHADRLDVDATAAATAADRSAVAVDTAIVVADTAIVTACRDQVMVSAAHVAAAHADVSAGRDVAVASADAAAASAAQAGMSAAQAQAAMSGAAVRVSAADTTADYLVNCLEAGNHISLAVQNPGGDERLRMDVTGLGALAAKNTIALTDTAGVTGGTLVGRTSAGSGAMEEVCVGAGLALAGGTLSCTVSSVDMEARDQLALTNLRLLLASSVASGVLMQGYEWELLTDEWASTSINQTFVSGTPGYYKVASPKLVFSYTGTDQSWVVPAGVTAMTVKLWGAGGGASWQTAASGNADWAGGGGFVSGTLAVIPGETLTLVVGQGGSVATGVRYGGGGAGTTIGLGCGSGGGRSAIRRTGADIVTAGGGGGSVNVVDNSQCGGVGGGLIGGATIGGYSACGQGGTQSAGGGAGTGGDVWAGSQYTGGNGSTVSGGGGGGGGWYGGGGGSASGGGGGSSYVANLIGATNAQATSYVAGGTADADYAAGIGYGQIGGDSAVGNGRIVISYQLPSMTLIPPVAAALSSSPTYADLYFLWKDESGSAVIGTDLTVDLSRAGDWVPATLSVVAAFDGTYSVIRARANLSTDPAGTNLICRIKTLNGKVQRIAAPALYKE